MILSNKGPNLNLALIACDNCKKEAKTILKIMKNPWNVQDNEVAYIALQKVKDKKTNLPL